MDLLGHSFFLYHGTGRQIQVVYRRADGGYGVLIPEAPAGSPKLSIAPHKRRRLPPFTRGIFTV